MQIKKSELRKVIQERLQMFFSDTKPFATVGRAPSMKSGIEDLNSEDVEVDQDALDAAIAETVKDLEKGASLRMQAEAKGVTNSRDAMLKKAIGKMITEISGVDSLKPNDPHTPEDEAEKDAADDVMEADPKAKKGRPRGGPHIENVRFWDLPESSLKYIIADASDAVKRLPMARKATKWADEVNDAVTVLHWRKKKGITVDESFNTAPYAQGKEQASVIGTNESPEIGGLAKSSKSKEIIKKMHALVTKQLKFKTVEDIQPTKTGVAFIFGDKAEASKMAKFLKKAGALGKVLPLAAGGGKRTMVSLVSK